MMVNTFDITDRLLFNGVEIETIDAFLDKTTTVKTLYSFGGSDALKKLAAKYDDELLTHALKTLARRHCDLAVDFAAQHGYFTQFGAFVRDNTSFTSLGDAVEFVEKYGYLDRRAASSMRVSRWLVTNATTKPIIRSVDNAVKQWTEKPPSVEWMTDPPNPRKVFDWLLSDV